MTVRNEPFTQNTRGSPRPIVQKSSLLNRVQDGLSNIGRRQRRILALIVLAAMSLVCIPLFGDRIDEQAPKPKDGVISFQGYHPLSAPAKLGGVWVLDWDSPPLAPPKVPSRVLIPVPSSWTGLKTTDGRPLPESGLATYDLTIKGLAAGSYLLYVPTVFAADRILLDGRSISERGTIGKTPASTTYAWAPQEAPITATGRDLHLQMQVAAFHHRSNGMEAAPVLGLNPGVRSYINVGRYQDAVFGSALIILFLFGSVVFLFRPSDLASLCSATSSLLFLPAVLVLGHDDLITELLPQLSFSAALGVQYITGLLAMMVFFAYPNMLFPEERSKAAFAIIEICFLLITTLEVIFIVQGDTLSASHVYPWSVVLLGLAFVNMVWMSLIAAIRQRDGALVFLAGILVFTVTVALQGAVDSNFITRDQLVGVDLAGVGMLVLLFAQIVTVAERWSLAIVGSEAAAADLRRLMEVSASIASEMQLDVLLHKIVENASKFLHADRSSLFLHDEESGELWSSVAEGVGLRELRFPSNLGIAGDCYSKGETVIVDDVYADERFHPTIDEITGYRTTSALCMPLLGRDGRKLGVMQALNRTDQKGFTPADAIRMGAFAAQASIAIENATLFTAVLAARNYNENILRSMSSGVVTLGPSLLPDKLNPAAARMLELPSPSDLASAGTFLAVQDPWLQSELGSVLEQSETRSLLDIDLKTLRGRKISANISIIPLSHDQLRDGVLLLIEDITQGKRLEGAMRRFLSQSVVDQVLERDDGILFGSACTASVLFCDVRNFTTLAEKMAPRATVEMLNELFTELVEAVSECDGVLDKFIGDAVMAVFGAPFPTDKDARNALDAALSMMGRLALLNRRRLARGEGTLRLGAGVATGELIAGTVGSSKRMDYTVIGDSVNLAARLQALTKHYKREIIVCERTALQLGPEHIIRPLGKIKVRGRSTLENIYDVLTHCTPNEFPNLTEVILYYKEGLEKFEANSFSTAEQLFNKAVQLNPRDTPSILMLNRSRNDGRGFVPDDEP